MDTGGARVGIVQTAKATAPKACWLYTQASTRDGHTWKLHVATLTCRRSVNRGTIRYDPIKYHIQKGNTERVGEHTNEAN